MPTAYETYLSAKNGDSAYQRYLAAKRSAAGRVQSPGVVAPTNPPPPSNYPPPAVAQSSMVSPDYAKVDTGFGPKYVEPIARGITNAATTIPFTHIGRLGDKVYGPRQPFQSEGAEIAGEFAGSMLPYGIASKGMQVVGQGIKGIRGLYTATKLAENATTGQKAAHLGIETAKAAGRGAIFGGVGEGLGQAADAAGRAYAGTEGQVDYKAPLKQAGFFAGVDAALTLLPPALRGLGGAIRGHLKAGNVAAAEQIVNRIPDSEAAQKIKGLFENWKMEYSKGSAVPGEGAPEPMIRTVSKTEPVGPKVETMAEPVTNPRQLPTSTESLSQSAPVSPAKQPVEPPKRGQSDIIAQSAVGGALGFEQEKDDQGNVIGYKYDPLKGLLGLTGGVALGMTLGRKGTKKALGVEGEGKPPAEIKSEPKTFDEWINTRRMNLSTEAQAELLKGVQKAKPQYERLYGDKMTNDQVVEAAKTVEAVKGAIDPAITELAAAQVLRARQILTSQSEQIAKTGTASIAQMRQFLRSIETVKSTGTDAGRQLQARKIQAGPETPYFERVLEMLSDGKHDLDAITEAASKIDLNNAKQVTELFRKFEKAKMLDVLREYRFINLLSSPRTHIVNTTSNLLQASTTRPATLLTSGIIDGIASKLTGKARQYYLKDVPAYYRAAFAPQTMKTAATDALEALKGKKEIGKTDIGDYIPTNHPTVKWAYPVLNALEAEDVFVRRIVEAGEKERLTQSFLREGKPLNEAAINQEARKNAEHILFRESADPTNKSGQGAMLSAIDAAANAVAGLRNNRYAGPVVIHYLPFLRTINNIVKQMVEHTPAGLGTLPGSDHKVEQLAKVLNGSLVFATLYGLAQSDQITWSPPKGAKEKEAFYNARKIPYSVLIGDQQVKFDKLGVWSAPLALAAAMHYYDQQAPGALSDTQLEKKMQAMTGLFEFMSDQSYTQGVSQLLEAIEGGTTRDPSKLISSLSGPARQYIPLMALNNWVTGIIDPVYRQSSSTIPQKFYDDLMKGIPGLSKNVAPYRDDAGNPSGRPYPVANAFSPVQVGPLNEDKLGKYKQFVREKQLDRLRDQMREAQKTRDLPEMERLAKIREEKAPDMRPVSAPKPPSVPKPKRPISQSDIDSIPAHIQVKYQGIKSKSGEKVQMTGSARQVLKDLYAESELYTKILESLV